MAITYNDILNKEFPIRFRGYDTDEVDNFLEDVAKTLASITKENNTLKEEIVRLQNEMEYLKREESELRQAVLSAHKLSEKMRNQVLNERKIVIEKAKIEAQKIINSAKAEITRLEARIAELQRIRRDSLNKVKSTLEGYLRMVEEDTGEMLQEPGHELLEELEREMKSELESIGLAVENITVLEKDQLPPDNVQIPAGLSTQEEETGTETDPEGSSKEEPADLGPSLE